MVAFGRLGRYFARRFLAAVALVFLTCVGLIALLDFFELSRRYSDRPEVSFADVSYLVAFRLPAFTEQVLPFAVLFGAMGAFLTLSRRLELVIARGAGMSVWQFTGSAMLFASALGVIAVVAYNPVSASLKEQANRYEAALAERRAAPPVKASQSALWIRQQSVDGQAIVQAESSADKGQSLAGVIIYAFDRDGRFSERIEAQSARLEQGTWRLSNARIYVKESEPQQFETYLFSTNLTADQVRGNLASADSLSFWELPAAIEITERAGLKAERYRLQYQVLLARPLLLVAMVMIAAVFSLRIFRLGGVGRMIMGGVAAGFLLYVAAKLTEELGEGGIVHPVIAGWSPAVFGTLMGCLVLLHQEDG